MRYSDIVAKVRHEEMIKDKRGADLLEKKKSQQRNVENHIAEMIDQKDALLRLKGQIARLAKTKDVQSFIQDISPELAVEMSVIALSGESEKARLDALKDLLDRAGFGKVQKHAVARIDAKDSKEAIIAHIMGSKNELKKQGIEIVEDDEDQEK